LKKEVLIFQNILWIVVGPDWQLLWTLWLLNYWESRKSLFMMEAGPNSAKNH